MRCEEKIGDRRLVEIWLARDSRERRRLSGALPLVGRYNMASRTPAFGERFPFLCICSESGCRQRGSTSYQYTDRVHACYLVMPISLLVAQLPLLTVLDSK
jgi:hypothetical protein